jgi:hypothetical protein
MEGSLAGLLLVVMEKMLMRDDKLNVSEEAWKKIQEMWERACADVGTCAAPMAGQPRELLSRRVLAEPDPKCGHGWDAVRAYLRYLIRFFGSAQKALPAMQAQWDEAVRRFLGNQLEAMKLHVAYLHDPARNKQQLYAAFQKLGLPPLVTIEDDDASPPQKRQRTQ